MFRHRILRLLLVATGLCSLIAVSRPSHTLAGIAAADPRVVQVSAAIDRDGDRVSDALEWRAAAGGAVMLSGTRSLDLLVALDHRPGVADRDAAIAAGGRFLGSFSTLVYAMRVALPASRRHPGVALRRLAAIPGVRLIEENTMGRATCYQGTTQTGARRAWSAHGFTGNSESAVAILDTGLDDTHPDFPPEKLAAWKDVVGADWRFPEPYDTYTDKHGHGTAVAGIACGSGDAAGMATTTDHLRISESLTFPPEAYEGYPTPFPVDTTAHTEGQTVEAQMFWKDDATGYSVHLCVKDPAMQSLGPDACHQRASDADQTTPPFTSWGTVPIWVTSYTYFVHPYADKPGEGRSSAYWVQVRTPMSPKGDGHNLMSGVAPGCRVVAVKVLDDEGLTTAGLVLQGLEWVESQRVTHHIIAANMSFEFDARNLTVETAVNNLVGQGVVCVAAAGNRRGMPEPVMTSPALASRCLTVAAISESDWITSYSSYGDTESHKPDLAAPGGSFWTQRGITAADSNDGERNYDPATQDEWFEGPIPDRFPDDYVTRFGTSMAAPYVTGAAALVADALGLTTLTGDQALLVKALLLMTASETNAEAEVMPDPLLNRAASGGWDRSEGYGRLNIDAAVAAALSPCVWSSPWRATLGGEPEQERVWARRIRLAGGVTQQFWLDNPSGADYDLYLYSVSSTIDGLPTILVSRTTGATGYDETFPFTPSMTQDYYLVVKRVSGSGEFAVGVITTSARLTAGWHLISLPNHPVVAAPPTVFPGITLDMRLFRYNPATKGYVAYLDAAPELFGDCDSRVGYWLYLDEPYLISYLGMPSQCEQQIALPVEGWYLIGYPFTASNSTANFDVLDTTPDGQRIDMVPAVDDYMWIGCPIYGWSVDLLRYTSHCPDGPPTQDSTQLDPWQAYWLGTNRADLALIMPPP